LRTASKDFAKRPPARRIVTCDHACKMTFDGDEAGGACDLIYRRAEAVEAPMPLIKGIEDALPLMSAQPEKWQKDIALTISKFMITHDKRLTMNP